MRLRSGRVVGCANVQGLPRGDLQGKEEGRLSISLVLIQEVTQLVSEERRLQGGLLISIFGTLLFLSLIIGVVLQL